LIRYFDIMKHRIPLTVITGFLGSGKTTILNFILRQPEFSGSAVIVNEFGDIGLDHLLVESALDQMVLMDNGCLCCTVRGDLVDTLRHMLLRSQNGSIPSFNRVFVETTGLADPAPVLQTLIGDEETQRNFRLKGIITVVDSVTGLRTLKEFEEARRQAATADLLLVTKSDLPEARPGAVEQGLKQMNPDAKIIRTIDGVVDPKDILALPEPDSDMVSRDLARWFDISQTSSGLDSDHGHQHHHHSPDSDIQTASITFEQPVNWLGIKNWLEWLVALRGTDILRIKGLVNARGYEGPIVIHGVQHMFHEPKILYNWPDEDHRTRIIIIAKHIPAGALHYSADMFLKQIEETDSQVAEAVSIR